VALVCAALAAFATASIAGRVVAKSYGTPGTLTQVATGANLTGGPITTHGTIGLSALQLLPTVACAATQVPLWDGSAWGCAGAATGSVTSVVSGAGLAGGPITGSGTLAVGTASVTLAMLASNGCTSSQILRYNGSAWVCAADATGTGTAISVASGTGLTGGPITGTGTLSIANGGVGTAQLADSGVRTAKILNAAVIQSKLSATGGTSGQALTTNGTALSWTALPAFYPIAGAVASITEISGRFQFAGPTVTLTLGTAQRVTAAVDAAMAVSSGPPQDASLAICAQNQSPLGAVLNFGGAGDYVVGEMTTTRQWVGASDSAVLAAGTYKVGFCVSNGGVVPIDNNGPAVGFVMVTTL
jgi:hypothetical protein